MAIVLDSNVLLLLPNKVASTFHWLILEMCHSKNWDSIGMVVFCNLFHFSVSFWVFPISFYFSLPPIGYNLPYWIRHVVFLKVSLKVSDSATVMSYNIVMVFMLVFILRRDNNVLIVMGIIFLANTLSKRKVIWVIDVFWIYITFFEKIGRKCSEYRRQNISELKKCQIFFL